MIGRNRAWEKDERSIAVTLRQVAENLVVSAILFDDVDDVFEWRIFFKSTWCPVPVVRTRDTIRELQQLGLFDLRRQRCNRAVQLSQSVGGAVVAQLYVWCWELRIRSAAFALAIQNQQRVRRH